MSGRKCVNCRHYEPSPIWRSGWCRNPRLYTPQESHLVSQDGMECAHRVGNYWEPIETAADGDALPDAAGGRGRVSPLRLFGPQPRLLAATASGGGGGIGGGSGSGGGRPPRQGAGSGGGGYDPSGQPGQPGRGTVRGGEPGAGRTFRDTVGAPGGYAGPDRPVQPGSSPGQERPVSYQPEERYWTDYLRIALPVVGLLLMLGLFWFWAASLIGDEDDDDPSNLAAIATATPPPPTPTPTPPPTTETAAGDTTGDETETADDGGEETDTTGDNAGDTTEDEDPNADDTSENGSNGDEGNGEVAAECDPDEFTGCEGATAVVTSSDVNVRSDPEVDEDNANVQGQFDEGDEVVILGEPVEGGDFIWIEVEDAGGGDLTGYMTVEFLQIE